MWPISCGFDHIYWRNPLWKTSFFVQWMVRDTIKKTLGSTGPSDLDTDAWSRILNSENFGTSRDEFEKSKSKYD